MKQMIFYCMTEAEIRDGSITVRSMRDIKSKGFDSIYLEYRNSRSPVNSKRFLSSVKQCIETAHTFGLKVITDCRVGLASDSIAENDPDLFTEPLKPHVIKLEKGCFTLNLQRDPLHYSIEKAWLIEHVTPTTLNKAVDVTARLQVIDRVCEGGGCAMTSERSQMNTHTRYRVSGIDSGTLFLLVRNLFDVAGNDHGNPRMRHYVDQALEIFRTSRVEGFAWDEPHFGFAFWPDNGRAINARLYSVFKKRFGYDLLANLIDLWYDRVNKKSSLVRLHYAEMLETELALIEAYFYKKATVQLKKSGDHPVIGIHRTMHEELSDDFFIGSVDYFRHNKFTTGGFSDSVFERDDSMICMLHFARSMAMDSQSGLAYNNSWGFKPKETHHDYYLSLMGAMNISWLGHAYHSSLMFGPGYPDHPLWKTIHEHLGEHRAALEFLKDSKPVADTAVLYTWPSLATYPDNYLQTHRRNLLFLAKAFTINNLQFNFISEEILAKSAIAQGTIKTSMGTFKRLIVPWANLIDPFAFARIKAAVLAGIQVVVFGPPPELARDGSNISAEFAKMAGIKACSINAFSSMKPGDSITIDKEKLELVTTEFQHNYHSNPRQTYPDHFKSFALQPLAKTSVLAKAGSHCVGVQKGSLSYFSIELPHFARFEKNIAALAPSLLAPDGMILFEHTRKDEKIITGTSVWSKRVSGEFVWNDRIIQLRDTDFFGVSISSKGKIKVLGSGASVVR